MLFSADSQSVVGAPRWATRVWLRVITLSHWHILAWGLVTTAAIFAYWSTLASGADEAEQQAAQQLAQEALTRAESDYATVERLLHESAELPYLLCSPAQVEALRQLDFDVDEVKEFGVLDEHGQVACTSSSGLLPQALPLPVPDATYDTTGVSAAVLPMLSQKRTAYLMRYRTLYALLDPLRWRPDFDDKSFGLSIVDLQSNKEIIKLESATPYHLHRSAKSPHFRATVSASGVYAQHWLATRKAWVVPLLAFAGGCSALVAWLLRLRMSSPLSRLERIILFSPKNVELVYQPVVGIKKAQVVGAEALLRLRDTDGSPLAPTAVFGVLEHEAGLCKRLTMLVLERALQDLKDWLAEDRKRFLGVNLTQHDLSDDAFPARVRQLIRRYKVHPAQLHLELLETSRVGSERTLRVLRALKELGCQLWIDDFGVGYSNLARLHTLPVHGVKLDRDWVAALDDSQHVRTDAVTHLVLFAGSNGLDIVAEGVSDELAMRTLLRLGVQQMQGFLFAPGLPLKELLHLSDASVSEVTPRTLRGELDKLRA